LAAVRALRDEPYYVDRYRETHRLRTELINQIRCIGIREIVPGKANFVMCHLDPEHPTAAELVQESRKRDVFLRDVSLMGTHVGSRAIRIAVKNRETNAKVIDVLGKILCSSAICGTP
jgi:histidinol-phosphate/aromatic aminotransferase/cobyric acid decarboxylase-like protein